MTDTVVGLSEEARERDEVRLLKAAIPDPGKLLGLALWLDQRFPEEHGTGEVQAWLRECASAAIAALGIEGVEVPNILTRDETLEQLRVEVSDLETIAEAVEECCEPQDGEEAYGFLMAQAVRRVAGQARLGQALEKAVEWAKETFPDSTAAARVAHMKREVLELEKRPGNGEEMADVAILLAGIASIGAVDLADATLAKLAVLRTRTWGEPDAEGVVEHVRQPEPAPPARMDGWGWPINSKKAHYFADGELTSVCRNWMFAGSLEEGNDESSDNHMECRRWVERRKLKAAKSNGTA